MRWRVVRQAFSLRYLPQTTAEAWWLALLRFTLVILIGDVLIGLLLLIRVAL